MNLRDKVGYKEIKQKIFKKLPGASSRKKPNVSISRWNQQADQEMSKKEILNQCFCSHASALSFLRNTANILARTHTIQFWVTVRLWIYFYFE